MIFFLGDKSQVLAAHFRGFGLWAECQGAFEQSHATVNPPSIFFFPIAVTIDNWHILCESEAFLLKGV